MDPYCWQIPLLITVGVIAGFLNVLAGGGSLLTLPLLIFIGLPAAMANGTNRVGIFCQSIAAISGFHKQGIFPFRLALICAIPAVIGSFVGANLALAMDELLFRRLLAAIMLGILLFTLVDPMRRWPIELQRLSPWRILVLVLSFFLIGIYGGFVQAGVGFLIISGLLLHGLDLVHINAVKVIVIFAFTLVALGVFMANHQIDYVLGFSLAVGNSSGGWLATRVAVKKGHRWIKRVVSGTVLVFAVKLLLG